MLELAMCLWSVAFVSAFAAALACGPAGLAWFCRRRARRDWPRARLVVLVLLVAGCASSPAPATLRNLEPELEPERVCQDFNARPAMFCLGDAILFYDGCRWDCVRSSVQWH